MIAIDTNVLLRIILDDEPQTQVISARSLLTQKKQKVFISAFTFLECAWVLKNKGFSPMEIADSFEKLLESERIEVGMRDVHSESLRTGWALVTV
jgi:predicted nucleic-acid-binding protein